MDGAAEEEDGTDCEGLMLETDVDLLKDWSQGDCTRGDCGHDDCNHGDGNRGDCNHGDGNHGDCNHGDGNRGDCNHGDGSHGDCNHADCGRGDPRPPPAAGDVEEVDVTLKAGDASCARHVSEGRAGMEGDGGLREQLAMVEAMVQEMKVGFMAALEQLSSMQDGAGEQGAWHRLEATSQRQDQQVADLSKSLDGLREEVSTLSSNMGKVVSNQQSLQDRLTAMQTSQQHLLDELVNAGVLSENSRSALSQCEVSAQAQKLLHISTVLDKVDGDINNPVPNQAQDADDPHSGQDAGDKTGVTATACKSLSLTQALAAKCHDIDVSDSSEDDLESSSPRRKHPQVGDERQGQAGDNSVDSAHRRQAVQEIVDSEEEYCSQLWTVVNVYQLPLQEGHYMSSRNLCILFPAPLGELYEQHSQMLHSLQDRLVHWSYAGVVGDVFARMTDSNSNMLGLYQEYVESLPTAISCLRRQLAQSRSFRAFVKAQKETNADADLMTLLISPLQRVPKYMLQLQQVLRHTREDHSDYHNLQASLSNLQDFVERLNQDITHTTQAIALDLQHLQAHGSSFRSSGSSCEMLPATTSTRDSGIHSAEDTFPRHRQHNAYLVQDMYLPNWLEQSTPYRPTNPRHAQVMGVHRRAPRQSRLASHSQPDLTTSGYSVAASHFDPQATVPQIRSPTKAAPAADGSARQRRYKIKKRIEGQGRYLSQSPSPHLRPASAIDFISQKEPQQRPDREQVMMRPHSVLGPFPGDGRSRVIQVYSRKQARGGDRQRLPMQHHAHGSQPHLILNGHWDPQGGGDQGLNDGRYTLVDYTCDDEEDDTRAMSDAQSQETSSSHKLSSRHSQDAHETETDNSEDYTQEDLSASLSHHLAGGSLGPPATSTWTNSESQQLHFIANKLQANGFDNDTDYLESPESGVITTDIHLSSFQNHHQPLEDMSELKLDLTCFHDDDGQVSSVKKSSIQVELKPPSMKETYMEPEAALSMKPMALNCNNSAHVAPDFQEHPSQNHQKQESVDNAVASVNSPADPLDKASTSVDKSTVAANITSSGENDSVTASAPEKELRRRTLPPTTQDILPSISDTNSRVIHKDFDRPPLRRSATPQEHSSYMDRPPLPRATTPSEYIGTQNEVSSSLSLKLKDSSKRRTKDTKNMPAENLHRSVEDVSSASKKKHFRTSLKNLFHRKK